MDASEIFVFKIGINDDITVEGGIRNFLAPDIEDY